MHYVNLVAILAVLQFLAFGALAGDARRKSGLKAPAMTGHEGFERMYRVQMNTLETLVVFLPALFLAAQYWPATWIAALGALYVIGRIFYWRAYVTNPANRAFGYALSMAPTVVLTLLGLLGIVMALMKGA
jgi:glutathione S-transferase